MSNLLHYCQWADSVGGYWFTSRDEIREMPLDEPIAGGMKRYKESLGKLHFNKSPGD